MLPRLTEVLLVEDNPGDARLIRETLSEHEPQLTILEARDGESAIALLRSHRQTQILPLPHLILLDLNLPRKDGREVLAEIKTDAELARIPVVVLTSSKADEDILTAYRLHANCYVTKPFELSDLQLFVTQIKHFWLNVVSLPRP